MTMKMVIADEYTVIRRGVRAMISNNASLTLSFCGEADSVGELLALLARETPDILLLGYTLRDPQNGMEGLALVKW